MALLLGVAFLVGVITAVSPCAFPVLPIVFAGGASGSSRRPLAIIAGVVVGFTGSLLAVSWVLRQLHLPQDLLRNISIALLFVAAATLLVPRLGLVLERPLARFSRRPSGDLGGGFVLGLALGLVFVSCGGLVLASIIAGSASVGSGERDAMALFYAIGIALPMLAGAYRGRGASRAWRLFRRHAGAGCARPRPLDGVNAPVDTIHLERLPADVR